MGLRNFSMDCARVLPLKEKMFSFRIDDAEELLRKVRRCDTCHGVRQTVLEHFIACGEPQAEELAEKLLVPLPTAPI